MKIDWIRKLTSRKFWLAVASFVSMLVIAFGGSENAATQTTALIMAGATVIGYILGEGLCDANINVIKEIEKAEEVTEDD